MSVLDRSCFSYQVAAGSTTSDSSVELVIRKSIDTSRSSLPAGPPPSARSRHVTSRGRSSGGVSVARRFEPEPSRCSRKYSFPFADDPSRLARQSVRTRGQFSGASGSSQANRIEPSRSRSTAYAAGSAPAALASSTRSRGFRSNCGNDGIQPSRADRATASAVCIPARWPSASGDASASAR
jgi:hypothetical protein